MIKNIRLYELKLMALIVMFLAFLGDAEGQDSNAGDLGATSKGQISFSLEITNRPNPTITLINNGGGTSSIPAFVADRLTQALSDKRNANFPVCIAGTTGEEITVFVESQTAEDQFISASDGIKIPFDVTIKGNSGTQAKGKKAQYRPNPAVTCAESTALEVEISIPQSPDTENISNFRGKFNLLLTNE